MSWWGSEECNFDVLLDRHKQQSLVPVIAWISSYAPPFIRRAVGQVDSTTKAIHTGTLQRSPCGDYTKRMSVEVLALNHPRYCSLTAEHGRVRGPPKTSGMNTWSVNVHVIHRKEEQRT